jgi:hypothetical protein
MKIQNFMSSVSVPNTSKTELKSCKVVKRPISGKIFKSLKSAKSHCKIREMPEIEDMCISTTPPKLTLSRVKSYEYKLHNYDLQILDKKYSDLSFKDFSFDYKDRFNLTSTKIQNKIFLKEISKPYEIKKNNLTINKKLSKFRDRSMAEVKTDIFNKQSESMSIGRNTKSIGQNSAQRIYSEFDLGNPINNHLQHMKKIKDSFYKIRYKEKIKNNFNINKELILRRFKNIIKTPPIPNFDKKNNLDKVKRTPQFNSIKEANVININKIKESIDEIENIDNKSFISNYSLFAKKVNKLNSEISSPLFVKSSEITKHRLNSPFNASISNVDCASTKKLNFNEQITEKIK